MIGSKMIVEGKWREPGVWNVEQLDPDAFLEDMNKYGLPWQVVELDPSFSLDVTMGQDI
jgi:saccharopine dehydrogenase (NAD+, L-lysine-forming)